MYVLTETGKRYCSIKVSVYFSIERVRIDQYILKYIYMLFAFPTLKRHLHTIRSEKRITSLFDFITRAAVGESTFPTSILPTRECPHARIVSILLILPHRQSCSADAASHAFLVETQCEPKKRQGPPVEKNRG